MNIIIEQGSHNSKFSSAVSLVNALTAYGCKSSIWSSANKNFYDMIDEFSPSVMFLNSKLDKKYIKECQNKCVRIVDINSLSFVTDVINYNLTKKLNSIFNDANICVANYLDVDNLNSPYLNNFIAEKNIRLFTPAKHFRSYGTLSDDLASIAIANAKLVLALSYEAALTASLCCNELFFNKALPEEEKLKLRVEAITNCNLIKAAEYLPIEFNWKDDCVKFLKNNLGVEIEI